MVITATEMAQQTKETTARELAKLHQSISENPALIKRGMSYNVPSESSESDDDIGKPNDISNLMVSASSAKNNTVPVILLHENQRLHKCVQRLSSKLERCRASSNETERRYEQIRIELAEKCLDLEDSRALALQKNIRIRGILAGAFAFVFMASLF